MDIRKGSINVKNIIGRKVGMTSVFTEDGRSVPVTVIQAGPCTVVQKKTKETDPSRRRRTWIVINAQPDVCD